MREKPDFSVSARYDKFERASCVESQLVTEASVALRKQSGFHHPVVHFPPVLPTAATFCNVGSSPEATDLLDGVSGLRVR